MRRHSALGAPHLDFRPAAEFLRSCFPGRRREEKPHAPWLALVSTMTTPLKALIQERLRAKIVENTPITSSDDGNRSSFGALCPPSLSETTTIIDPNEYSNTLSRCRSKETSARGSMDDTIGFDEDLKHYNADLRYESYDFASARHNVMENDYEACTRFDERASDAPPSQQLVSPVQALSGKKRQWEESVEAQSPRLESDQPRRNAKPTTEAFNRPDITNFGEQPRQNYDLSDAYKRYRELGNHRDNSRSRFPSANQEDELHVVESPALPWRPNSSSKAGRVAKESRHDSRKEGTDKSPQRPGQWLSPPLGVGESFKSEEKTGQRRPNSYAVKTRYDHPLDYSTVHRPKPEYKRSTVSPVARSRYREITSPRFGSYRHECALPSDCRGNTIVFHSTLRVPVAPRSPGARLFLPHDEVVPAVPLPRRGLDTRDTDDMLSPDSQQAAKEFVEKRQKRTAQGTPRTMATHRWLQSMANAERGSVDSPGGSVLTPLTAILGDDPAEETRRPVRGCDENAPCKSLDEDRASRRPRHRREDAWGSSSSPIYSPARYASARSFSSAV